MSPNQTNQPSKRDEHILTAFGVLSALAAIEQTEVEPAQRPVLINDIYAFVQGHSSEATEHVERALCSNLRVRRQYMQLLKVNCLEHIAKPRAAHSDGVFERRVGEQGALLKLKQSKGNSEQYYLILELTEVQPEEQPFREGKTLVLHANTATQTQRAVFPPLHDGKSQIILKRQDAMFSLLQDHDVEIDIH